jgi:hypothetical protein
VRYPTYIGKPYDLEALKQAVLKGLHAISPVPEEPSLDRRKADRRLGDRRARALPDHPDTSDDRPRRRLIQWTTVSAKSCPR